MDAGRVTAVAVGRAGTVSHAGISMETGIDKRAVDTVFVGRLGVADDAVLDVAHHGGPDQAVYVYTDEDAAWWAETLGRPVPPGLFGENVRLEGLSGFAIGDVLELGDVRIQVTAPRIPCSTLAARMQDAGFVKRFVEAGRPGFYARVLAEGTLAPGVSAVRTSRGELPLEVVYDAWYARPVGGELLARILASPVAHRTREAFLRRREDTETA
ncbi:MAG: MOSC domain-containing protein [Alphaproteobacteria bacterium]|nr:MOSC domain-containing protein [Alphaproteobacteria bacterium]